MVINSSCSRLLKCASHPDNTSIISPRGGIVNVALADPASLSFQSEGYLWSNHSNSWVLSSLMGRTTYFPSSGIRQICAIPFSQGWHRFTAVLAEVLGHNTVHFQSFRGGVTFGTNRYQSNGNTNGIASAVKQKKGQIAPIKGSSLPAGQEGKNIALSLQISHYPCSSCFRWTQRFPARKLLGATLHGGSR